MRRGGAEARWSTVPPWLPVGLGTRQVPGKLGTQVSLRLGPQDVQRSLGRGGWEAGGPEDRHLQGPAGLSSEWDRGEAPLSERGRVWSGRGWEGAETSAPLSPPPMPRAHTRMPSRSLGGPGSPSGPRARPDACWSGVGGVRGAGRRQQAGVRSGSCGSNTARPPTRGAARWPDLQVGGKGRRSARLLGRPAPTASVSGHISLKAPDLVCSQKLSRVGLVSILDGRPPGNPGC